jgi:hydrogenase/urease accessory protein HupE
MIGKLAPLLIGLAVWLIAGAVTKRRSYILLIACIVTSYLGFFLGLALVMGPSVPDMRIIAVSLIGAMIASAAAAYVYSLIDRPPPTGS